MSNIVETDKFEKAQLQRKYDALLERLQKERIKIETNPWPALMAANTEIQRLMMALHEVYSAVYPSPASYKINQNAPAFPIDIRQEAFERLNNVRKIVDKALWHE